MQQYAQGVAGKAGWGMNGGCVDTGRSDDVRARVQQIHGKGGELAQIVGLYFWGSAKKTLQNVLTRKLGMEVQL